jgi:hypothetical protein
MDLPLDRDLEGRPLSTPMTLSVEWQDRMVFDGRTACFEESVVASGPQQRLLTETLEVQFQQPIDFSAQQIDVAQRPKVEQILCRGGVRMESETIENEATVSHEQMQVPDLGINLNSGALTAGGPGWLSSVRPADSLMSQLRPGAPRPGVRLAGRPANADASGLRCLHVRFQGSISGNVLDPNRQMTFHDQVNVAYAPVDAFNATLDASNPESLGPDGVVMHCDRLSVHEMDTRIGKRGALELEATGNTVVEGMAFTARAVRLTYAEAKDMLVLEGDGRTDAELYRQKQVGGQTSKATARKILFWPKSDQIHVEGARSVELNQFSTGGP